MTVADPIMMARAEVEGVGDYRSAGPKKPVVRIYCKGCTRRNASEVGQVYTTQQGLFLMARRTRAPLEGGGRDSSTLLVHLLTTPLPAPPADWNWIGHCQHCGYFKLPTIEVIKDAYARRKQHVFC